MYAWVNYTKHGRGKWHLSKQATPSECWPSSLCGITQLWAYKVNLHQDYKPAESNRCLKCVTVSCGKRGYIQGGANMKTLSIPDAHALRIARDTLKLSCVGALVLGGPNHKEAATIIWHFTGRKVEVDSDCTCEETRP